VAVVTYSLSRLSEQLSPIPTVRLTQDRTTDAATIGSVLTNSDLVIYPEGTTCRESFLLRFSKLSAKLNDDIVPMAMECRMSVFYNITTRGWKARDPSLLLHEPEPGLRGHVPR
jgi:hypothetical protein